MTILVIDDEPDIREMICEMLELAGYRCLEASNSKVADELLETNEVDGVTLDLHMPGRSGIEWLETLESIRPGLARRTLLVTGSQLGPEQIRQLKRCGASLLFKPFDTERLLMEIKSRVNTASDATPLPAV